MLEFRLQSTEGEPCTGETKMQNERSANEAIADYNQKEFEQRQAWQKVLATPAKREARKPVKQGFFSRLFKGV